MPFRDPAKVDEQQARGHQRVMPCPATGDCREPGLLDDGKDLGQGEQPIVVRDQPLQAELVEGKDQSVVAKATGQPSIDAPDMTEVEFRGVVSDDLQQDRFGEVLV